ncbi:hypothetical protein [Larkinella humicola]|uniref:Uncharacterized protein n=1 Tax=Larkinella humicola TaxID=2607654 RepID=A0A5N1JLP1_9BACT|nr:hypothetical protein [Larkinella humicola]KAA9356788.1 hypothetical protein F0P93_03330 [Larkinella humicola]
MAIITNLDPERRILPHGTLLVEEVSMDEEVWCAVEEFLEKNGKVNELYLNTNFHINTEGKCIVRLSKKTSV